MEVLMLMLFLFLSQLLNAGHLDNLCQFVASAGIKVAARIPSGLLNVAKHGLGLRSGLRHNHHWAVLQACIVAEVRPVGRASVGAETFGTAEEEVSGSNVEGACAESSILHCHGGLVTGDGSDRLEIASAAHALDLSAENRCTRRGRVPADSCAVTHRSGDLQRWDLCRWGVARWWARLTAGLRLRGRTGLRAARASSLEAPRRT